VAERGGGVKNQSSLLLPVQRGALPCRVAPHSLSGWRR
jgi:hypothetical protein